MSEKPVQVFLSYARSDDVPSPEDNSKQGFVSVLLESIKYYLNSREYRPDVWRDIRNVNEADQFDDVISKAISASSLFLVAFSPNWLRSDYCRRELAAFEERWGSEGENIRERIVVASKHHVDLSKRPPLLRGQEGFKFFALDAEDPSIERELFICREHRDPQFYARAQKLAVTLSQRAERLGRGVAQPVEPPPAGRVPDRRVEESARSVAKPVEPPPAVRVPVFLAKPARDMQAEYDRLSTELVEAGYDVVPDPAEDMPLDSSAEGFIDEALAKAVFSIHLLGDKPGFAPEGASPFVGFQLARAAAAAGESSAAPQPKQRLIWTPKFLGESETARDPHTVLARFDASLPNDKLLSNSLSEFSTFVLQRLAQLNTAPEIDSGVGGDNVYVWHRSEDLEFACSIGTALLGRDLTPQFPAYEGPDAERANLHRQHLRECDWVLICWATAPDVWVKAFTHELADWKILGRTKGFARRGLVAGPPPGVPKRMVMNFRSKREIDTVLDLTAQPNPPTPEDLQPIFTAP